MGMQRTMFDCAKSIAGTGFIALGSFASYQNLAHLRSAICAEGPDLLPCLTLTASRALHTYAADHLHFLQIILLHMLDIFWPLLLAITGTVLSRDFFTGNGNGHQKKDCGPVDLSAGGSTPQ